MAGYEETHKQLIVPVLSDSITRGLWYVKQNEPDKDGSQRGTELYFSIWARTENTHIRVAENLCKADADWILECFNNRYLVRLVSRLIGHLLPLEKGYLVTCPDCITKFTQVADVPLFAVNLGQYQQNCCYCNKPINPNANEHWPVLFE